MNWLRNNAKALLQRLGDLSPDCKAATRLQSEALDHRLTFRQRVGLRLHLLLCKWCRRYGKQITFVRNASQAHPDEVAAAVPDRLSDEARERIRQKLRSHTE
jgi:hypothetical protein